jgi:glutathione S-transferase
MSEPIPSPTLPAAPASPVVLHVDARFLSPYAMSAYVALHEKGVAFTLATVDLRAGENARPERAGLLPTRRVPVLTQGDFGLAESSAIDEYVDEAFAGPPLYPAGVRERALARQVQAWLRSDLMPIRSERPTEVVFEHPEVAPLSEAARAACDTLYDVAHRLLAHGGEHLFGGWCIADTDLALMLMRLVNSGEPVPARLAGYATAQWARPSVRRWIGEVPGRD